jgi:hypothetical protein
MIWEPCLPNFLRSGGDRFREDQAAIIGTGHPVLVDGLPRFVFNKGKSMPGGFTVPGFFLPNRSNATMIDPILIYHKSKMFQIISVYW